jgi:hypothetical protein
MRSGWSVGRAVAITGHGHVGQHDVMDNLLPINVLRRGRPPVVDNESRDPILRSARSSNLTVDRRLCHSSVVGPQLNDQLLQANFVSFFTMTQRNPACRHILQLGLFFRGARVVQMSIGRNGT